jgi:hypothetical protein
MISPTAKSPGLATGWSFPFTPAEVAERFPEVGSVSWRPSNTKGIVQWGTDDEVLVYLTWFPGISRPQPILTLRAIPSQRRAAVRQWIEQDVVPELRAWLESLPTRSASWLEHQHLVSWKWRSASDPPL